jgi:3-hydroxybutyryl-CoA dehydrogenase
MTKSEKRMTKSEKRINSDIQIIGIIGEGKMGTNLFYYLRDYDFSLVWVCSKDAETDKIIRTFNKKIKRLLETGIIDETAYSNLQFKSKITRDLQQLKNCDLIIEAIPEKIEVKRQLFWELEKVVTSDCIIASNSSSIKPSDISTSLTGKNRIIGLHFFYPVSLKNIVEFIISTNTSTDVIEKVNRFLSGINRDYLLLQEKDSFILNKIYLDFQNEAFLIVLEENLTISQMDALIKKHLFPAGVFEFCDNVGNDIMLASVRNYTGNYPNKDQYRKFTLELERLVNENRFGVKSGAGFYSYPFETDENDIILIDNLIKKVIDRLHSNLAASITRFSSHSGISSTKLNNAMKEYLDSDRDLVCFST